ncbi:hypothetical protein KQ300_10780 [Synechococcus sp. CS-1331]|nr:hypothetical protein [Synechococcus sp. CS-1331]
MALLLEGVDGRLVPAPPPVREREPAAAVRGLLAAGFAAARALGAPAAAAELAAPGAAAAAKLAAAAEAGAGLAAAAGSLWGVGVAMAQG